MPKKKEEEKKVEIVEETKPESNIIYYGVYYATDGNIILLPGKTQEECLEKLAKAMNKTPDGKYRNFCKGD